MKLTEWFNTREIDDFARSIADEIIKRVPPGSLSPLTKKAAGQLKNSHHSIFGQAEKFALTHPLNLYKKARLGDSFRWSLRDAGYPSDLIESWTYELVTFIVLKAAAQKKSRR